MNARLREASMKNGLGFAFMLVLTAACSPGAHPGPANAGAAPKPSAASSHPNFSGIWASGSNGTISPSSSDDDPTAEDWTMFPHPEYTPEYEKKWKRNRAAMMNASTVKGAGASEANLVGVRRQAECLPYGMPTMMGINVSFDIVQADNRILVVGEIEREIRRIWLDRPQLPLDDVDLGWFGRSVGQWEGDTLVINTIGVKSEIDGADYMPHTDEMVITERWHLENKDVLVDDVTITDPVALKKPWTFTYKLNRYPKAFEPSEFVCENNRFHIGARGNVVTTLPETPHSRK
jgi:hypothetical protein